MTEEYKLTELPEKIREQSIKVLNLAEEIEKLRKELSITKNKVRGEVLLIKEGDKLKYTNNEMRDIATEERLFLDSTYNGKIKELSTMEYKLKLEQIQSEYLHNLFRMHLMIKVD